MQPLSNASVPTRIAATVSNYVHTGKTGAKFDKEGIELYSLRHFSHPARREEEGSNPLTLDQKALNVFSLVAGLLPPFALAYAVVSILSSVLRDKVRAPQDKATTLQEPAKKDVTTSEQEKRKNALLLKLSQEKKLRTFNEALEKNNEEILATTHILNATTNKEDKGLYRTYLGALIEVRQNLMDEIEKLKNPPPKLEGKQLEKPLN